MESLEVCGEMKLKAGEIAEGIIKTLIENGYEVARTGYGYIYNDYEVLRRKKEYKYV